MNNNTGYNRTHFKLRSLTISDGGKTNDEVYKRISFGPVVKALLDTPQMQRLREIKQLGTASYTYINANHTRFEHSIGVSHLAEAIGKNLQERQPTLHITSKDILCIQLAGLLHDIGHGPYSHVFEEFRESAKNNISPELLKEFGPLHDNWSHEDASMMMIDAALEYLGMAIDLYHLDEPLEQIGDGINAKSMRVFTSHDRTLSLDDDQPLDSTPPTTTRQYGDDHHQDLILTSRDWIFIKECITGAPLPQVLETLHNDNWIGRPKEKEFLYDIVHNRHSGLDVDKLDYFARDRRRALAEEDSIKSRLIDEALVAWSACPQPTKCFQCQNSYPPEQKKAKHDGNDGNDCHRQRRLGCHLMICYPQKMAEDAMSFFKRRYDLHTNIYRHKTTTAVAYMIQDILTAANPYFQVPVTSPFDGDGSIPQRGVPISHICNNKVAYLNARDSIIQQIWCQKDTPQLLEAHKLIDRLLRRDLYKCSAVRRLDMCDKVDKLIWGMTPEEIRDELIEISGQGDGVTLLPNDIIVEKCDIHHGCKDKDPVALCRFLPKDRQMDLRKQVYDLPDAKPACAFDYTKPSVFQSNSIRVFCRGSPEKVQLLTAVFLQWEENFEADEAMTPDHEVLFMIREHNEPGLQQQQQQRPLPACSQESDGEANSADADHE